MTRIEPTGLAGAPDGRSAEQVWPLTEGQRGIALQQMVVPDSPIFNVPAALELTGPLDRPRLAAALGKVVDRQGILRVRLGHRNGALVSLVEPEYFLELPIHDLRHLPETDRRPAARHLLDAESARPFDLFTEPGLRLLLVVLADDRHVLFWNLHHLVCDGWSKSVFARELSLGYAGRLAELPALTMTYGDHAKQTVQTAATDAGGAARLLAYWDRQLDGVDSIRGVPPDLPRQATSTPRGQSVAVIVDAATRRGLTALARERNATAFMALHAGLAVLVRWASAQPDVVVNIPYGVRPAAELEHLIGFFVNVLALRYPVSDEQEFAELIDVARDVALDAYDHSGVAYQRVVERVATRHGGRIGALHQTSLAFANLPYEDVALPGLAVERFELTRVDIRYELEWHLWEDDASGGFGGRLIYRTDLFAPVTAQRLVAGYQALLAAVVDQPWRRVGDLRSKVLGAPPGTLPPDPGTETTAPEATPPGPDGDPHTTRRPPTTATEEAVFTIWVDLLNQDELDVDDDFFTLGGNSMLLAFMADMIRDEYGFSPTFRRLVEAPTIAAIAAAVDEGRDPGAS